jgi:hypothetical protein
MTRVLDGLAPRPEIVARYRLLPRRSPKTRRSPAAWTLRLMSSTEVFGQTRAMSSSLLTSSPVRSTKATRMSKARLPSRTGFSPSSRSRRVGSRRKGPNAIACSTGVADRAAAWSPYWSIRGLPAGHSRCRQCQTSARAPPSSWEASTDRHYHILSIGKEFRAVHPAAFRDVAAHRGLPR